MTIAVDIGNTNIDVALFEGEKLIKMWRVFTDVRRTGDEYASVLKSFFRDDNIDAKSAAFVTLSSVVPSLTESFSQALNNLTEKNPVVVSPAHFGKIPLKIATSEMGADLVCDALEAYCRIGGACITVDFGTAATEGAVLLLAVPGSGKTTVLVTRLGYMVYCCGVAPESVLGMNTTECIQSGVILGYKGLIEYLVGRMKTEMAEKYGETDIKVVATGGLSSVLSRETNIFDIVDRYLTVCGIRRFGEFVAQNE